MVLAPIAIISSPAEPDFFINAKPSYVLRAISPKSSEEVLGILPVLQSDAVLKID